MLKDAHPFWSAWSRAVIGRPRTVIAICVLASCALGVQAYLTPRDLSFTGILDTGNPEMAHFVETVEAFGANSMLVLLLEGPRPEIDKAIGALVTDLPGRAPVKTITPPANPEWLIARAPWIWPRGMFDAAIDAVESGNAPEALLKTFSGADDVLRKALRPADEAALVGIGLHRSPLDMAMGGGDFYLIEAATKAILEEAGFTGTHAFTGIAATAAQDQSSVMLRIQILSPITFIAVLIMILFIEPRVSRVLVAGAALGFSVLIAFGLTGLLLGRLSIMVTFFGMLLLGLGIDFGIHLLVPLRDARAHGHSPEDSVAFALKQSGTAIALGAMTTALAFGVISLAPEPGAKDMGYSALFGIVAALLLMLTFLPASWLLLERRDRHADAPPHLRLPGLRRAVTFSLNHPWLVVSIGAALTIFGIAGIPRYQLESDLKKIISRQVSSFDVDERLEELFGVSPVAYLAPVESLEQARDWSLQLKQLDDIAAVTSVADVILPDAPERTEMLRSALQNVPADRRTGPLYERLARANEAGAISIQNLPPGFSNGLVGQGGKLAVSIVPKKNNLDAHILREQINRVQSIAPTATGMPIIVRMAVLGRRDYIPIMIPAILATVIVVLVLSFRNFRDVVLGLVPVVMGTAISFGVFLWLDIQMSVLTGAVVPVILGLGVDDGIHVVERMRQYRIQTEESIHEAVEGVGRAIFLTTSTTCVSFVALLFTNHPGLEAIAVFMLMGMTLCFILSVTVLPAAAKLWPARAAVDEMEFASAK